MTHLIAHPTGIDIVERTVVGRCTNRSGANLALGDCVMIDAPLVSGATTWEIGALSNGLGISATNVVVNPTIRGLPHSIFGIVVGLQTNSSGVLGGNLADVDVCFRGEIHASKQFGTGANVGSTVLTGTKLCAGPGTATPRRLFTPGDLAAGNSGVGGKILGIAISNAASNRANIKFDGIGGFGSVPVQFITAAADIANIANGAFGSITTPTPAGLLTTDQIVSCRPIVLNTATNGGVAFMATFDDDAGANVRIIGFNSSGAGRDPANIEYAIQAWKGQL